MTKDRNQTYNYLNICSDVSFCSFEVTGVELVRKLRQRVDHGDPVRVGIIGCGQMGSGLAHTVNNVVGMRVAALADIEPERAIAVFIDLGWKRADIIVTEIKTEAEDAVAAGRPVVTPCGELLTATDPLEANVEATGVPDIGAMIAYKSILNRKPIIMLNVETDVTIGFYLQDLARKMGSLYTVASGDEPGVCKMLYEQAVLMGFEVVCLGKGKNNPIDYGATPESCTEEARSKDMNPKILASFKDGTKTMVEMASVSNATGLLPDIKGMHGPTAEREELLSTFVPKEAGGIFSRRGTVDFTKGKIAPGVFAVVYSNDPRIRKDMDFITNEKGPYYLHFRPYHLCDIETPQSIAEAVLMNEVTVVAEARHSEVVCTAKRELKAGQIAEGIGGRDWYGTICTRRQAVEEGAIPIGIAPGGKLLKNVPKGAGLTFDNFAPRQDTFIAGLRLLQEKMMTGSGM